MFSMFIEELNSAARLDGNGARAEGNLLSDCRSKRLDDGGDFDRIQRMSNKEAQQRRHRRDIRLSQT